MNAMNLNPSATTISEEEVIQRFNDEFTVRADAQRLVADRSTKLGDFRLEAEGGSRLWLRQAQVETLARLNGLLKAAETVHFNHAPMAGRAYASPT